MIKLHLEETVKSTHAPLKAKEKATYTKSYGCDMIMVYKATPRTVAPFD